MNGNKTAGPTPFRDSFGRPHNSLRISVTDRCNIRCFYCMPEGDLHFLPRSSLLTYEEIHRFVAIAATVGIDQIRITGGEPLVRSGLPKLVRMLKSVKGISDLAITTNGVLLDEQAQPLRDAGLDRLNISLDSLRSDVFRRITRRDQLQRVLRGIQESIRVGFDNIRINAVSIAGLTEPDILPLAEFCRAHRLHLRFIEFMPLDADREWTNAQVLTGEAVRKIIEQKFGALRIVGDTDPHQPARDFIYDDGIARIGFVNPVSQPFCSHCNRLRITAEGQLRNCLFSHEENDVRELLRNGSTDDRIVELIEKCVQAKKRGHGIDDPGFAPPIRAMYQIGG